MEKRKKIVVTQTRAQSRELRIFKMRIRVPALLEDEEDLHGISERLIDNSEYLAHSMLNDR